MKKNREGRENRFDHQQFSTIIQKVSNSIQPSFHSLHNWQEKFQAWLCDPKWQAQISEWQAALFTLQSSCKMGEPIFIQVDRHHTRL
jgi:hypothetical protein